MDERTIKRQLDEAIEAKVPPVEGKRTEEDGELEPAEEAINEDEKEE